MKRLLLVTILTLIFFLTACTPLTVLHPTTPQEEACQVVYCENSEGSIRKQAGLRLIEMAAGAYNIELELGQGICTSYYKNRVFPDYRYAFKSAIDICNGGDK